MDMDFTDDELFLLEVLRLKHGIENDMQTIYQSQVGVYSPHQNPVHENAAVAGDVSPGVSFLVIGIKDHPSVSLIDVVSDIRGGARESRWFDVAFVAFDGSIRTMERSASDCGITPYWMNDHPVWNPSYVTFINDESTRSMVMDWLIAGGELETAYILAQKYPGLAEKLP